MAPAGRAHGIPMRIRNTFNPEHPGTRIRSVTCDRGVLVKGISGGRRRRAVNLEGAGMIGVPGTADRLFGALREAACRSC
jgi:bifunctional aspartokinase / homoserine dehydrogenase 1